jgi:hypothetical protein
LEAAHQYIKVQDDATGEIVSFSTYVKSLGSGVPDAMVVFEDFNGQHPLKIIPPPAPRTEPRRPPILSLKEWAKMNSVKKD